MAWMSSGVARDAHMGEHRAALLGEAGHVDHAAALAFEMRGHAEHGADGDDAGAADAVDDRRPALARQRKRRGAGTPSSGSAVPAMPSALRILAPCTVTKDGQKPLTQEKSLLQLDWSMRALAAELGLDRLDRDAVRLHAAIAAAFADQFVDDHALVRVGKGAALAAAALFGRAGLVVDQHRDALAPRAARAARRRGRRGGGWWRPAGNRSLPAYLSGSSVTMAMRSTPSARTCLRDHVDRQAAFMRLAAGHRDGVVVEDLVGDVGARPTRAKRSASTPEWL